MNNQTINNNKDKKEEKAENSCIFQEIKRKIQEKRGKNIAIFHTQKLYTPVISGICFSKTKNIFSK